MKLSNINKNEKNTIRVIIFAVLFFFIIQFLHQTSLSEYTLENYLLFHTLLEFISIFVSFSIFIHGWITFSHYPSRNRIIFSLIFLQVGAFDLFHTLVYKGMPFFQDDFAITKATSLWLLARATDSIGLAYIFLQQKDRVISNLKKNKHAAQAILLIVVLTSFVMLFPEKIPTLVDDQGVTGLKIAIEYVICIIHVVTMVAIVKIYKKSSNQEMLTVFVGLVFLLLGELIFTIYTHVHSLDNLLGHVFKVFGYFYLMRGIYFPQFEQVFHEREEAEQKWLEAERRLKENEKKMTSAIIHAQEDERKRVSRDLHDGIGQIFYSIVVTAQMLKHLQSREQILEQVKEIELIAGKGMKEVKRMATELRPSALDDLGLVPALRSYSEEYEKTYQVTVHLQAKQIINRTTPKMDTALYRIYQEALTNIAKYANAKNIDASLIGNEESVVFTIKDDGKGFQVEELNGKGIGLFSMKERAQLVNGSFSISSIIGKGTTIVINIPLEVK